MTVTDLSDPIASVIVWRQGRRPGQASAPRTAKTEADTPSHPTKATL